MRCLHPIRPAALGTLVALLAFTGQTRASDRFVDGEVLVTFHSGVAPARAKSALAGRAMTLDREYRRLNPQRGQLAGLVRGKGRSTAQLMAELRADPTVESVEPNFLRHVSAVGPADPDFPKLWGLHNSGQRVNIAAGIAGADTKFLAAWNLARPDTGEEIVVAVVDTGMDIGHPDLIANLWTNHGEIPGNGIDDDRNGKVDDVHGYDFVGNTGAMTDSGDHGTHVAGTIAATGGNGIGVIGLQHRAKILPLKVSSDGKSIATSAVLAAFDYAIALKESGVNLVAVNASYGGPTFSVHERAAVIALRDAGIVLCAAAGNDAANNDSVASYPANYDLANVISVAAITPANQLASFSNFGATKVDLAAPGSDIYSTLPVALAKRIVDLRVAGTSYPAVAIESSGVTTPAGLNRPMYSCGLGVLGEFPPAVKGNIALIRRGSITFADKLANARAAGAVAAVIYDNTADPIHLNPWTLGDTAGERIPGLRISQADGTALHAAAFPASASLAAVPDLATAYGFMNGTSMAAPHVAGAVAFAAMAFPADTLAKRIDRILANVTPVPALAGKVATGGTLDLLRMIDTDNDRLPDWWEDDHFGGLAAAAAEDPDGDGFPNEDEFLAATSPVDSTSKLAFSSVVPGIGNSAADMILTFHAVAEREYQVEWSADLDDWAPLGSRITGTGSLVAVHDPAARTGASRRFYRLRLIRP